MITTRPTVTSTSQIIAKVRAYAELTKARLSLTVVFSSAIGYLLATQQPVNWLHLLVFAAGGFLVTAAANTINQIIEIDLDKLMRRTQNRPLPSGRLSVKEATGFTLVSGFAGLFLLFTYINALAGLLSFLSLVLYAFVYTPLKRVGPVAVFVGAIPGALPPMIGWAAASGTIGIEAFTLFAIQFVWQFPHFWAIAWVANEDYKRAGFRLLPSGGGKDVRTAFQIMIYTLFLLPLTIIPARLGITGLNGAVVAVVCGSLFLGQTFYLMKECSQKAAKQMMFASIIYLPIIQIAFLLDKV